MDGGRTGLVEAFVAAFNSRDLEAIRSLLAPEFVDHTPVPDQGPGGGEFLRVKLERLYEAFADLELTVEQTLTDGDRIAWGWTLRGRNAGPFAGRPATGRPVRFGGLNIDRIVGGRIAEHWSVYDSLELLQQLGLFVWGSPSP